jgi:hypothetical protein
MLKRMLPVALVVFALHHTAQAQPHQTMITGRSTMRALHEAPPTGPMRTTLTRENKYPDMGQLEAGGFFEHEEYFENDRDSFGLDGRIGVWENVTFGAAVPFVDSEFLGESNQGLGDVALSLDLVAYQDIFRYPFVIPHVDVSLPTGDEDDGLGAGESIITLGVSVGTKVYDQLTYVIDAAYSIDGRPSLDGREDMYLISGSIVWDISDRFAVLAEGRIYEENDFDNMPYEVKGGMAYKFTRDVQLALYGGQLRDDTDVDNKYDLFSARLAVTF